MSIVGEVYRCCLQLGASAVKARKDALTTLLRLLDNDNVKSHLDEVTQKILAGVIREESYELPDDAAEPEGRARQLYAELSWNKVMAAVIGLVELECERLIKKPSGGIKVRPDLCSAVRLVMRRADQGRLGSLHLFLTVRVLFKHVSETLKTVGMAKQFAPSYCQLLCDILSVPSYCILIKPKSFKALLKILRFFVTENQHFPAQVQVQNARALLCLVRAYPFDLAEFMGSIMACYTTVFSDEELDDGRQTVFLLSGLNHVCLQNAVNESKKILEVGDKLCGALANRLARTRDAAVKRQLLLFCQVQIRLHKAFQGCKWRPSGMFAASSNIRKWLDAAVHHLVGSRMPSGKTDRAMLERPFYVLLRDVVSDLVHLMHLSATGFNPTSPVAKRQRTSGVTGDDSACSDVWDFIGKGLALATKRKGESALEWILCCGVIAEKYGKAITWSCLRALFDTLVAVVEAPWRVEVELAAFEALTSLAGAGVAWSASGHPEDAQRWETLWQLLLRKLAFPSTAVILESEMRLLCAMMCASLVDSHIVSGRQEQIWSVSAYELGKPAVEESLVFLVEFCRRHELQGSVMKQSDMSIRAHLLTWVVQAAADGSVSGKLPVPDSVAISLELVACAWSALIYPGVIMETVFPPKRAKEPILMADGPLESISDEEAAVSLRNLERSRDLLGGDISAPSLTRQEAIVSLFQKTVTDVPSNSISVADRSHLQQHTLALLDSAFKDLSDHLDGVLQKTKKTLGVDLHLLCIGQTRLHRFCELLCLLIRVCHASGLETTQAKVHDILAAALPRIGQSLSSLFSDLQKAHLYILPSLCSLLQECCRSLPASLAPILLPVAESLALFLESQSSLLGSAGLGAPVDSRAPIDLSLEFDLDDDADQQARPVAAVVYNHDCVLLAVRCLASLSTMPPCDPQAIGEALAPLLELSVNSSIKCEIFPVLLAVSPSHYKLAVLEAVESLVLAAEHSSKSDVPGRLLRTLALISSQYSTQTGCFGSGSPGRREKADQTFNSIMDVFLCTLEAGRLHWTTRCELCTTIVTLLQSDFERFDKLSVLLVCLGEDSDFHVRQGAATGIAQLFTLYSDEVTLFQDIKSDLEGFLSITEPIEYRVTTMLAFCQVGIVSKALRATVVFMMLSCASDEVLSGFVEQLLLGTSLSLGYSSVRELVEEHFDFIARKWMRREDAHGRLFEDFPYFLCGCKSLSKFVSTYVHIILPLVVYDMDEGTFIFLADKLGVTGLELVSRNFASVFTFTFPLYFTNHHKARDVYTGFLKERAPELKLGRLIAQNLDDIIIGLIDNISVQTEPAPPLYTAEKCLETLRYVAKGMKLEPLGLLLKSPGRVQSILIHLIVKFQRNPTPAARERVLHSLKFLTGILEVKITTPNVTRSVVHLLLLGVADPSDEVRNVACDLLRELSRACVEFGGAEELGQYLNLIVSALSPLSKEPAAYDVLVYLLRDAGDRLGKFISELDPLSDVADLSEVIERWASYHELVRSDADILRELKRFRRVLSSRNSSVAVQLATLVRLTTFCKEHRDLLYSFAAGHPHGQHMLSSLIWELIRLGSPQRAGADVQVQVAKCLGELGIMNLHSIAFSADQSASSVPRTVLEEFPAGGADVRAAELSLFRRGTSCALYILSGLIVDTDPSNIVTASRCLTAVLSTGYGKYVFKKLAKLDRRIHSFLLPFSVSSPSGILGAASPDSPDTLCTSVADRRLWDPSGRTYDSWITNLAYQMAMLLPEDAEVLRACAIMCRQHVPLAEALLPYVFVETMSCQTAAVAKEVAEQLESCILHEDNTCLESVQYALSLLNFVRDEAMARGKAPAVTPMTKLRANRSKAVVKRFWESSLWPAIDFLTIAAAAQRCAAFLTSVMFVEYWIDKQYGEVSLTSCSDSGEDQLARSLLLNAYSSINEPDTIMGISQPFDRLSQIKIAEHEGQWNKVAFTYDTVLHSFERASTQRTDATLLSQAGHHQKLLAALQNSGYEHITSLYLKGFASRHPRDFHVLAEAQFESHWRSSTWQLDADQWHLLEAGSMGFHRALHSGLRAVADDDAAALRKALRVSRTGLMADLQSTSLESTKLVHPVLLQLHMVEELENSWEIVRGQPLGQAQADDDLMIISGGGLSSAERARWQQITPFLSATPFDVVEPLLALRSTVLKIADAGDSLGEHLRHVGKLARKAGRFPKAATIAYQMEQLNVGTFKIQSYWEQCKLFWAGGEHSKAIAAAEDFSTLAVSGDLPPKFIADVLYTVSKWMTKTGSTGVLLKVRSNLRKARDLYAELGDLQPHVCKTHFVLASYLDGLYLKLAEKVNSPEWEKTQLLRQEKQREVEAGMQQLKRMAKSERGALERLVTVLKRQVQVEKEESRQLEEELSNYVEVAVQNYLNCLVHGGKHDSTAMFRVCSLWFANSTNEKVNRLMKAHITSIPSHKWVPLMYQIASRMTSARDIFQTTLHRLIGLIAVDHPYHSLYQLFALSNGDKVRKQDQGYMMDDAKVTSARNLLDKLRRTSILPIMKSMEPLVGEYISLANMTIRQATKSDQMSDRPLPASLASLRDLTSIPIVTMSLPVEPSATYTDLVTVRGFKPTFSLVGGVNLPRLIVCLGSDGREYKQLVKGKDDLRQDAVMQQMFHMVNRLLMEDPQTRTRKLTVRTYRVVPLSPAAGLLEWVENTMPLSEYLTGTQRDIYSGAHARYRPKDMLSIECKRTLHAEQGDRSKAFRTVMERFKPVFHHFFLENYRQPAEWFEKRLAYTRSVASNSIVGYIVGLGDRHISNILLDTNTAEVVHIDLGVAFEQGKMLRFPELVPFRLTRDLVDAMGVTGVEGVFRTCCQETMRVLREQYEALLTIVEVFLHDPLYRWALSPLRALALQQDDEAISESEGAAADNSTRDAEKTLIRVRQKLQGVEYGGVTSVEEQIALLIDEARDPDRLCKMFIGWRAWV